MIPDNHNNLAGRENSVDIKPNTLSIKACTVNSKPNNVARTSSNSRITSTQGMPDGTFKEVNPHKSTFHNNQGIKNQMFNKSDVLKSDEGDGDLKSYSCQKIEEVDEENNFHKN